MTFNTKMTKLLVGICTFVLLCACASCDGQADGAAGSMSQPQLAYEYDVVNRDKENAADVQVHSLPHFDVSSSEATEASPDGVDEMAVLVPQEMEMGASIQRSGSEVKDSTANDAADDSVEAVQRVIDQIEDGSVSLQGAPEPVVTQKKYPCVGCASAVDIDIDSENRRAVEKMGEHIVSLMDNMYTGPYIHASPRILNVMKQVDSGIRYTITFVSQLSWCTKENPRNREDCAPQSEGRVCSAELLKLIDKADEVTYNNCTDFTSLNNPSTDSAPTLKLDNDVDRFETKIEDAMDSIRNAPQQDDLVLQKSSEEDQGSAQSQENANQSSRDGRNDRPESTDTSEESVDTDDSRLKRYTNVGALTDVDSSEKDLLSQFAELAVKTLDEVDPDDSKRVVLGVMEAKKQIVSGVMYHMVIRVGTSTCREEKVDQEEPSNCVEDQLLPEKICRVQIHRSWANESPLNAKVVKSECADMWPVDTLDGPQPSDRKRRSSPDYWPSHKTRRSVPGGLNPADPAVPYIKELIDFALADIAKNSQSQQRKICVVDVQKQVVAGMLVHLKLKEAPTCSNCDGTVVPDCKPVDSEELRECSLKVIDQAWLKHREVLDSNCNGSRRKRDLQLGAPKETDVNGPYVKELADFALSEIDKGTNSPYEQKIVKILEAKKQVVSGTLMHLKLQLITTNCPKSGMTTSASCNGMDSEDSTICSVKVWDQPWTKTRQVQDVQCGSSRSKRDTLVGAPEAIDVEDTYVKELAEFAVAEIDKGTDSPYKQQVVRVTEAKKQVVAGVLMHLKMELVQTSCKKSEGKDDCTATGQEKQVCSLKVWDQPWTKKREVQDVQCGTVRTRRSIDTMDSPKEVDVSDPYVISSAEFALEEIDKATNSPYRQKVVNIIKAHVDHGESTTVQLHMEVGYSSCKKSSQPAKDECNLLEGTEKRMCYVEINHHPWMNRQRVVESQCVPITQSAASSSNSHLIGGGDHDVQAGLFREFIHQYNKTYSSDDELKQRFHIFKENLKLIKELQAGEQGTATYGPTMFADLTREEFKQKYLGLRVDLRQENNIPMHNAKIPKIKLPDQFDWRDHNAVTPVKNQGSCGSCWAFAVTGNLEGQYAVKHGKLLSLSEQELVDCDTLDDGCRGGLPENAYHALEQLGGIETEQDYPYEGDDEQCHFKKAAVQVKVASAVNITTDETAMAKWLVKNGPIAIGINANAMQFYVGGVSHPFKFLCSPGSLDHGVLIVGYGVHTYPVFKKVLPFWTIKNSWGERWGEQGYYRIYRGDGSCGVNQMASSAVVE